MFELGFHKFAKFWRRGEQRVLAQLRRNSNDGMTIVEIMVVLAVAAMIMGLGVMGIGSIGAGDLKADANRFTSTLKYGYSSAAINNTHYRLVIDLDTGEYYTEVAQSALVDESQSKAADTEDFLTEDAKRLAEKVDEKRDLFEDEEENPFGVNRKIAYDRVHDAIVKPQKLKDGNRFARVVTMANEDGVESGLAMINFYPNGFQDQAMIVIKTEEGDAFTLITEQLSGSVKAYSEEKDIPDDFGEVEDDG